MVTSNGTVVSLVGDSSAEVLKGLAALRNVEAVEFAAAGASELVSRISRSHASYFVSDADPLLHVAAAWVEFYDDLVSLETLSLEAETAAAALQSGATVMPDYYLVLEPETVEGTWRHWWFGALARKAPTRVLPVPGSTAQVRALLRQLPTGRPWGELAAWLRGLPYVVPDTV
ncbi:hypothetical protein [Gryllotalpicola sp.]|uniref:hypothetical protein n=1 Tax=Gryllotalpicola sp. TaxID=1932787 RepID=UPI00260A9A1E|nr:hypothetical protein [Gryllotalpicola sp.]